MAEKVEQSQQMNNNQNDGRKIRKSPDFQPQQVVIPASITRERSFVRTSNHQVNIAATFQILSSHSITIKLFFLFNFRIY